MFVKLISPDTLGFGIHLWASGAKINSCSFDRRKSSGVHSCSVRRDPKQAPHSPTSRAASE